MMDLESMVSYDWLVNALCEAGIFRHVQRSLDQLATPARQAANDNGKAAVNRGPTSYCLFTVVHFLSIHWGNQVYGALGLIFLQELLYSIVLLTDYTGSILP